MPQWVDRHSGNPHPPQQCLESRVRAQFVEQGIDLQQRHEPAAFFVCRLEAGQRLFLFIDTEM